MFTEKEAEKIAKATNEMYNALNDQISGSRARQPHLETMASRIVAAKIIADAIENY